MLGTHSFPFASQIVQGGMSQVIRFVPARCVVELFEIRKNSAVDVAPVLRCRLSAERLEKFDGFQHGNARLGAGGFSWTAELRLVVSDELPSQAWMVNAQCAVLLRQRRDLSSRIQLGCTPRPAPASVLSGFWLVDLVRHASLPSRLSGIELARARVTACC